MPSVQQFFRYGMPVFAGFVALEFILLRRQGRACSWKEGATSFAIGIGNDDAGSGGLKLPTMRTR